MPAIYSPSTSDLIAHLERLGHGPLLAQLADLDNYTRTGKPNLSKIWRAMGLSRNTVQVWYTSLVDDARAELDSRG